jgi:hypothetical protein
MSSNIFEKFFNNLGLVTPFSKCAKEILKIFQHIFKNLGHAPVLKMCPKIFEKIFKYFGVMPQFSKCAQKNIEKIFKNLYLVPVLKCPTI